MPYSYETTILNCNCFFCPLEEYDIPSEEYVESYCYKNAIGFVFSDIVLSDKNVFGEKFNCEIFNTKIYFYKILTRETEIFPFPKQICYCISTSGSTGIPKTVYVPYACISPNIISLSNILRITSKDIVMLIAPTSFDPFVIEFFLALSNGAALIVTSKSIRLNRHKLLTVMFPTIPDVRGATILQMTPSLFRLLVAKDVKKIFGASSPLRVLLLGGEEFPHLEEWQNWLPDGFPIQPRNCGKRIFNIYGITEVSCWSTIYEYTPNDERISLGTPIDSNIKLRVVDRNGIEIHGEGKGELQIGSHLRKSFYSREEAECSDDINIEYRSTGDLVDRDGNFQLFYVGRLTNTIKRFGKRVCLDQIATSIKKCLGKEQSNVVCDFDDNNKKLTAFIALVDAHSSQLHRYRIAINKKLDNHEKPDKIQFLQSLPLTSHGKQYPRHMLKKLNERKLPIEKFKQFLEESLGINDINFLSSLNVSFTAAGGTSFHALVLAMDFDQILLTLEDRKEFITLLLNGDVLLRDIVQFLNSVRINSKANYDAISNIADTKKKLKFVWKANLEKCVDATPNIISFKEYNCICVGSHACAVFTLNATTGEQISVVNLPDRIESQVTFISKSVALVGCYNGHLYALNFLEGQIIWEYNIGGMIKSKPVEFDNSVIVASYAVKFNLICICLKDHVVKWQNKIGLKGILATPLLLKTSKIIVCSLDGTYACVCAKSGAVFWTRSLVSPIFSTPGAAFDDSTVIIAEVKGVVNIINTSNGVKVCYQVVDGNIFSGVTVQQNILCATNVFIMFGCHDHNFYCLNYNCDEQKMVLHWKYFLSSPIYSTPKVFKNDLEDVFVCACSTKGIVVVLNICWRYLVARYHLKQEVFSSPCVSSPKENLYIGCRDNFLYCLSLT